MHESVTLEYLDGRITVDPDLCDGRPTIRGLRVTVETVPGFLSAGECADEILRQYPSLEAADIDAYVRFLGTSSAASTSTASTSGMPFLGRGAAP